ncbi:hypothetical protein ScPMuIL_017359 [Solemya velum]
MTWFRVLKTLTIWCSLAVLQLAGRGGEATGVSPTLRLPARNHLAVLDRNLPLYCIAEGTPLPTVRWTKGREDLSANDKHYLRLFSDGNTTVALVVWVLQVDRADLGDYTCIAANSMGTSKSTTTVYGVDDTDYPSVVSYAGVGHRANSVPSMSLAAGLVILSIIVRIS